MQSSSAVLRIEPLGPGHDRAAFDSGEPALDDYLRKTARQHAGRGVARTFVLVTERSPARILGFFTLTVCEVDALRLPAGMAKKYPRGRLPGAKLARLAVRREERGKGYGGALLIEALRRVAIAGQQVGCVALFVDAKNDRARAFYEHFGFQPLPDRPLELFLPFSSVLTATAL